VIIQDS